jgi:hypothetical protein
MFLNTSRYVVARIVTTNLPVARQLRRRATPSLYADVITPAL